jgi:hypothetical protein
MNNKIIKLPFESRYIKERILNYGIAYTNYKTYQIININSYSKNNEYNKNNKNNKNNKIQENSEKIKTIYVDNISCSYNFTKLFIPTSNLSYYVEIHYTLDSKLPVLETFMKDYEIKELLEKYVYVIT